MLIKMVVRNPYTSSASMMTSSNGNIFRVTDLCEGNPPLSTGNLTEASDAELWCFLWSAPEQTVEHTIETLVIWDSIALIIMSLLWISAGCLCVKVSHQSDPHPVPLSHCYTWQCKDFETFEQSGISYWYNDRSHQYRFDFSFMLDPVSLD